jgi:hypothetical protein
MAMRKSLVFLSMAWLAALIGVAWLWNGWQSARSANASLRSRIEELSAMRPTEVASIASTLAQAAGAAPATPVQSAATREEGAIAVSAANSRALERMSLPQQYPDLGEELGLRPDELEKLFDLLADRTHAVMPQARAASDAAIAALLGTRMADWQQYEQSLPARRQVTQLRGQLAASGGSLEQSQVRPLIAALNAAQAEHQSRMSGNPLPRTLDRQQRLEADLQREKEGNRRMVEAAAPFLDKRQQDAYQRMLDQQMALVESMMPVVNAAAAKAPAQWQAPSPQDRPD